jgi:hypothetical protein
MGGFRRSVLLVDCPGTRMRVDVSTFDIGSALFECSSDEGPPFGSMGVAAIRPQDVLREWARFVRFD